MKIGVISDSHGSLTALRQAVAAAGTVEMWLHAGDYSHDADRLAVLTGLPVTAVAGNCDGVTDANIDEFIEAGGKKIWLTHGHRYRVRERCDELAWWGRHYGVDVVVYGHSHIPDICQQGGVLIFNPGGATHPRGGFPASCGLLDIDQGRVTARIIEL